MEEIKGVFFDLGGTLRICDEDPEHQRRARERMAELAGYPDAEPFAEMINARYEPYRVWALGENREAGDFELWAKWLLPELPAERLHAICHEMTYQYRQVKGRRRMVEGGIEVIKTLYERGYQLGIISNLIGEQEIGDWLQESGLKQYFRAVVLSSVCHIRKPDPEVYRMGCRELGLEPGQCLSVADNLGRDIIGAKAAGIGCNVLFTRPKKLTAKRLTEENRPDYIVYNFADILNLKPLQKGVM